MIERAVHRTVEHWRWIDEKRKIDADKCNKRQRSESDDDDDDDSDGCADTFMPTPPPGATPKRRKVNSDVDEAGEMDKIVEESFVGAMFGQEGGFSKDGRKESIGESIGQPKEGVAEGLEEENSGEDAFALCESADDEVEDDEEAEQQTAEPDDNDVYDENWDVDAEISEGGDDASGSEYEEDEVSESDESDEEGTKKPKEKLPRRRPPKNAKRPQPKRSRR